MKRNAVRRPTPARKTALRGSGGMTLVEVVVSVALLGVVLLLLTTTVMTTYNLLMSSGRQQKVGDRAAAGIEMKTAGNGAPSGASVAQSDGSFSITFNNGADVTASGTYLQGTTSGTASGDAVNYFSFQPQ